MGRWRAELDGGAGVGLRDDARAANCGEGGKGGGVGGFALRIAGTGGGAGVAPAGAEATDGVVVEVAGRRIGGGILLIGVTEPVRA